MENTLTIAQQHDLSNLSESVIYLMGISFVLGSLFTIFILVLLELSRSKKAL